MITRTRLFIVGAIGLLALAALVVVTTFGSGDDPGNRGGAQGDGAALSEEPARVTGFEADEDAAYEVTGDSDARLESPAEAAPPGPNQQADLPQLLDRKIILNTSLDIGVEDVSRQFQEILSLAETSGGFVSSSSFSSFDEGQSADVTIRVPGDQYQRVLGELRGMGNVTQESTDANDVTEEYTDLQARLRTLEATEQRYLELLNRAENVNDILTVQDRLDSVRGQIEQVQGRINLLDHLTELATITVHLRPLEAAVSVPAPDGGGIDPLGAAENAWEASLEALRGLAAAALVVVVFSWWLLPPLAALAIAARWWLVRRTAAAGPTA